MKLAKKVIGDMIMAVEVEKEAEKEKVSKGGIILTGSSVDDENDGALKVEVVHVGSKVEEIEVGDKVLIQPYGNNKVKVKGREAFIFRESVAICVLDE